MSPSASDVLLFPIPLILLVHLHILEYPHANNPEYDNAIFNPRTRGLRERAKTMEDVAYFLVGRIEGRSCKTILPTYPCIQPSESLAFRTSLTKYLENLRHQCIYPSSSAARTAGKINSSLKASDSKSSTEIVAWWWKDVVVRKSLLEECSGGKFERLMLSLSTHALMKASRPILPDKMSTLLRNQPVVYTSALARYQATRHAWTKSASLLMRSESDLQILRESLNGVAPSKYSTLATERLQALAESKLQILLQQHWAGEAGRNALFSLVGLAGIRLSSSLSSSSKSVSAEQIATDTASKPTGFPSPLPIAAAHHPAHLKRLRKPIFQSGLKPKAVDAATLPPGPVPPITSSRPRSQSHAEIILAAQVDSEKRMRQALGDALSRLKRIEVELNGKLEGLSLACPTSVGTSASTSFWAPAISPIVNFDPKPDKALMLSVGLEHEFESLNSDDVDANEDILEKKIQEIRFSVLPPYPPIPDPLEARKPPLEQVKKVDPKARIPILQSKPSSSSSTSRNLNLQPPALVLPSISSESQQPPPPSTSLLSPSKSSRSIRRKSVRFSMAKRRSGRPSMFKLFTGELEDEVDRLVNETHDFPTDDEDEDTDTEGHGQFLSPYKTPKSAKTRPAINRIWTAGTPMSGKNSRHGTPKQQHWQKPRASSSALGRLVDMESGVGLPSLGSLTSEEDVFAGKGDETDEDEEGDAAWGAKDVDATPRPARKPLPLIRRSSAFESTDPGGASPSSDNDEAFGDDQNQDVLDGDLDDPPSMTLKDILLSADTSHFDLLEFSSDDIGEGALVDDTSFVWE